MLTKIKGWHNNLFSVGGKKRKEKKQTRKGVDQDLLAKQGWRILQDPISIVAKIYQENGFSWKQN